MFWNFLALHKNSARRASALPAQGGFGLIELMVSITIMAIVAGVILARQSAFNSAVLLRNQAYEIALQLREVQLSAVSASGDSGDFRSVLGVYFDTSETGNRYYRVFKDLDSDGYYDAGEEYGMQGVLDSRFEIREIHAGTAMLDDVSVIFVRPNFDARFFKGPASELGDAVIRIIVARRGAVGTDDSVLRTVEITATGQIGVQ